MKAIKSYPTRVEADLARIALDAAGVPSVVVGIGVGMEGGMEGVQLLVPEDRIEAALAVLNNACLISGCPAPASPLSAMARRSSRSCACCSRC